MTYVVVNLWFFFTNFKLFNPFKIHLKIYSNYLTCILSRTVMYNRELKDKNAGGTGEDWNWFSLNIVF